MVTKLLALALGYAMEVALGSGGTVCTANGDITGEHAFGNSIRVLRA